MLHLVFQPLTNQVLFGRLAPYDDVVFLENAVFACLKNGQLAERLAQLLVHNHFFVLLDDMAARGVSAEDLPDGVTAIDYAGLVALAVKNPVIQSWS